jgi:hypothetical protein
MTDELYTRTTGKLKKTTHSAFGDTYERKKGTSTIYTLGDDDDNSEQHPTGTLSPTQKRFIESFLQGITHSSNVDVDLHTKAIHWIGFWTSQDKSTILSCSILQPDVRNAMAHLSRVETESIKTHESKAFPFGDMGKSIVSAPRRGSQTYSGYSRPLQANGRYAAPLIDSLIQNKILEPMSVSWGLLLLSGSQPIFILSNDKGTYECRLTHDSCAIMASSAPSNVGIVPPSLKSKNYSFRSRDISGGGTGPSITINVSGTLQYQGKPDSAYSVGKCFKESIESVMASSFAPRFIKSLAILREMSRDE